MDVHIPLCTNLLIFFVTTVLPTNEEDQVKNSNQFRWLESDNRFDCIVGITADDKPIGIGVLVYEEYIITSANPLEQHLQKSNKDSDQYSDPNNKIKFHVIDEAFDKSKVLTVRGISGNIANRNDVWIRMGFNKTHSPIHDLMVIKIDEAQVKKPPVSGKREAFYLAPDFNSYFTSGWTFAGFGFVDTYHIAANNMLETTVYEDSEEINCDEWIPRAWGRFICLMNLEKLEGVQSGAPLFHGGVLRGIGSFALRKGKEYILVFTDYEVYTKNSVYKKKTNKTEDAETKS